MMDRPADLLFALKLLSRLKCRGSHGLDRVFYPASSMKVGNRWSRVIGHPLKISRLEKIEIITTFRTYHPDNDSNEKKDCSMSNHR
ncbi:hypothetical protein NPIL_63341 [Nephila pilipes]|uniref:Uncharacterized protein n=1 Tax=Nephila pilipes TaxID=299642 RepID=A0A8X6T800_NEPPI|nr:hypothetical protein NPIL_63341 [Nephila pilipes]